MRTHHLAAAFFATALASAHGFAVDHANLDKNRPLRIQDAYAIPEGELVIEFGVGIDSKRNEDDQFFAPVELLWGALPNLQIGFGTTILSNPHDIDDQRKSGDLHLSALYNLNQETALPALAFGADLNVPTGIDSAGIDGEIAAIVTKSIGNLSLHVNAGYEFLSGTAMGENDGLWTLTFGASAPIGAPMHTRTTLLADVFVEQAHADGEDNTIGIEAGVRHQFNERIVIDAGIGTQLEGATNRSRVVAMVGMSITF